MDGPLGVYALELLPKGLGSGSYEAPDINIHENANELVLIIIAHIQSFIMSSFRNRDNNTIV